MRRGLVVATALVSTLMAPDLFAQQVSLNGITPSPVPAVLQSRTILEGALVGESMDGYAGYVLTVYGTRTANNRCPTGGVTAADVSARPYVSGSAEIPIKATKFIAYQSIVDKGAAASVKLFGFAANLSNEDRAQVVVQDVAEQSIPVANMDVEALKQLASQPLPAGVCGHFFIRKAILTTVTSKRFSKSDGNGNVAGMVFSAGGKVYASTDNFQSDPYLTVEARDIRDFAKTPISPGVTIAGAGPTLKTRLDRAAVLTSNKRIPIRHRR